MTRSIRAASAVAFVTLTLVLAACNTSTSSRSPGSSGEAASPGAASAGAASTGAAPASAGASSSAAAEASAPPPSGPPAPFDLSAIIGGLTKLDSYHETISVAGQPAFDAVVVTKPELARAMTITGGTKVVIIGDKGWMSTDGTTFQSIPAAMIGPMTAGFSPELLLGPFGGAAFTSGATDVGTEEKNGVDAHHYHMDATTPGGGFASFPPDAAIDVWVADEGHVVAIETKGFTGNQDIQLQVTKVNDPSNKVEEPS